MADYELLSALLESWHYPLVVADTEHIIRYMNKKAVEHYGKRWGTDLIGKSLLDCHNEDSRQMIIEILAAMREGEDERLITDNAKHRVYMRAVRAADGSVLGYYERYEPPVQNG